MTIQPGDRVAYSARFLRATGQQAGPLGHLRGVVRQIVPLGPSGLLLAAVAWDDGGIASINAANLVREGRIGIEAALADMPPRG